MSIRVKALISVGLTLLVILVGLYVAFSTILMTGFVQLEERSTQKDVMRAERALSEMIDNLAVKLSDWAMWDDTYDFMKDRNPDYIESNLGLESVNGLGLNHILFIDSNRNIIEERSIDSDRVQRISLKSEVAEAFSGSSLLVQLGERDLDGRRGVLLLPNGPLLFAALPILSSERKGPVRGVLVFARYISSEVVTRISELSNAPVSLVRIDQASMPTDFKEMLPQLSNADPIKTRIVDESTIAGYGLYPDAYGNPAIILRVDFPREIYRQGEITRDSMLGTLLLIGIILAGVIALVLERVVLRRVTSLSKRVDQIGQSGDAGLRVEVSGADEISALGRDVNRMLERLDHAADELGLARERAEAASHAKSIFVANMSHEVRTPINGVVGMTQILLGMSLPAEVRQYVQMAQSSARSLLAVVNDILDFAKIEAGKIQIEQIEFSLRDMVLSLMQSVSLSGHEKGLELIVRISGELSDCCIGDSMRLRQVLTNLIGNAIKFTEKGEIELAIGKDPINPACVLFSVRDTGVGIPKDKQQGVFSAFSQADASTTRRYGGTGLGLTICKQLVELMGGTIEVRGDLGLGSTFSFSVDLGTSGRERYRELQLKAKSLNILIIEENHSQREAIVEYCRDLGAVPHALSSFYAARSALKQALERGAIYDFVIFDAKSEFNSFTPILQSLAENEEFRATTVIAMLPSHKLSKSAKLRELGVARVLCKPVLPQELFSALNGETGFTESSLARAQNRSSRSLNILVVDDTKINRTVAQLMLEQWGHKVTLAEDGKSALRYLTRPDRECDLVLMDIQMPIMDGLETTALLRAREEIERLAGATSELAHLPVIALSAHALEGDRERFIAAGMDGYVPKPLDSDELFKVVEQTVGSSTHFTNVKTILNDNPLERLVQEAEKRIPNEISKSYLAISVPRFDSATVMARLAHDLDIAIEVITVFLEECPQLLDEAEAAVRSGDREKMQISAHKLKGSLSNAGAFYAAELAHELETKSRLGDLDGTERLFSVLKQEIYFLGLVLKGVVEISASGKAGSSLHL